MVGSTGIVGMGKTNVLKGVGVIEVGFMKDSSAGILDMKGPGSTLTSYSSLHHIILITDPKPGIGQAEYSYAIKMAGLKAAKYIAKATVSIEPDEVKVYEIPP